MMFAPDIEEAIQRFAEQEHVPREEALAMLVRDWLIGQGLLELVDFNDEVGLDAKTTGGA